MHNKVNK